MNARSQIFEMSLESRQVQEAVLSLFHTVLFHRSFPKYNFQSREDSWVQGSLGFEDVDCDYINHTYVKAQSQELDALLKQEVAAFHTDVKGVKSGQVSLEFFQKKRKWPFQDEKVPWEVWTIKLDLVTFSNESDRRIWQEKVGEMLADKVMYIAEVINRQDYVPMMNSKANLDLVYDTRFSDVQPYLFKVSHATSGPSSPSVSTTVRRLLKDTLAI